MSLEGIPNKKELLPNRIEFVSRRLNALLLIDRPDIPERISKSANDYGLSEKREFHLSVITSHISKELIKIDDRKRLEDLIRIEFSSKEWKYSLLDEYFLIEKKYESPEHIRRSIVQRAELPDLPSFYEEMSKITGLNLETPPAHLTLFTGSNLQSMKNQGIGVYSETDIAKYAKHHW